LNKHLVYLIVLLVLSTACGQATKKLPDAVSTIDTLISGLDSYENQLSALDSQQIINLSAKIEMHLASPSWKENEAAISSLLSAKKFLESLPPMQKSLKEYVKNTKISAIELLGKINNDEITKEAVMSQIALIQTQSTAIKDQVDYYHSRYHAQALLIETLDKAQKNE
jgi:Tfp pilus assembly protein PilP